MENALPLGARGEWPFPASSLKLPEPRGEDGEEEEEEGRDGSQGGHGPPRNSGAWPVCIAPKPAVPGDFSFGLGSPLIAQVPAERRPDRAAEKAG